MDWFNGTANKNVDYQVFELDKAVTGDIEAVSYTHLTLPTTERV